MASMSEFFINKYVVQVESLARYRTFRVIGSKADLRAMAEGLLAAIENPPARPQYLPSEAATPLWSEYATEANRQTDRVRVEFGESSDLSHHHSKRKFKWIETKGTLGFIFIVACGVMGFFTIGLLALRAIVWLLFS